MKEDAAERAKGGRVCGGLRKSLKFIDSLSFDYGLYNFSMLKLTIADYRFEKELHT